MVFACARQAERGSKWVTTPHWETLLRTSKGPADLQLCKLFFIYDLTCHFNKTCRKFHDMEAFHPLGGCWGFHKMYKNQ